MKFYREELENLLVSVLKSVQQKGTIVLVSFYSIEERFARNLICHLDKADMQNYIFLNDNSEFLVLLIEDILSLMVLNSLIASK
jgi:16S rRNA C1402 N4-methylase RsmH